MKTNLHTVSVLLTRCEDLPDQWAAHCLEFDLVTQGSSIEDAMSMATEAVAQAVVDDLERGLDPFDRPSAPDEDWELFHKTHRYGRPLEAVPRDRVARVVARMRLAIQELASVAPVVQAPKPEPKLDLPSRLDFQSKLEAELEGAPWWMALENNRRNSDPHCST